MEADLSKASNSFSFIYRDWKAVASFFLNALKTALPRSSGVLHFFPLASVTEGMMKNNTLMALKKTFLILILCLFNKCTRFGITLPVYLLTDNFPHRFPYPKIIIFTLASPSALNYQATSCHLRPLFAPC